VTGYNIIGTRQRAAGCSSGRLLSGREHDGCLACHEAKRERLLEIEPDDRVCVTEIADGNTLAVVAAPSRAPVVAIIRAAAALWNGAYGSNSIFMSFAV
jgi:hypothetical protein